MVLFDTNNNDNQYYGFGVNNNVLRYQTPAVADDHIFYSGASNASSNQLMRIKGNGNVGIGNINPTERLEVDGKTKTTNLQVLPATAPTIGQVLTANDVLGNATWQTPTPATNTAWGLTGNSGTTSGTNFIGNTDDKPIEFRINNQRAGYIGMSTNFNTFLGHLAGLSLTTGDGNTAIGKKSLQNNTDGRDNTAVGQSTLFSNTSGNFNSSFGISSLAFNTTGSRNTAFGVNSLNVSTTASFNTTFGANSLKSNTTGAQNIAFGNDALGTNIIGNNNAALGLSSLINSKGNNNTALGWNAGNTLTTGNNNIMIGQSSNVPIITADNQMSIANVIYGLDLNTTATGKIGIRNSNPTEALDVSGKIKTNNLQVLPTTAPVIGQVLTASDVLGNMSWQTPATTTIITANNGFNQIIKQHSTWR